MSPAHRAHDISALTFYLSAGVGMILLFLVMQPKITSMVWSPARHALWSGFESRIRRDHEIDSRDFWKTREFYSPGSFTFNQRGLHPTEVNPVLGLLRLSIAPHHAFHPFLIYRSAHIMSVEALTDDYSLLALLNKLPPLTECIITTSSTRFCHSGQDTIILFIKPLSEMKRTNAFMDYARDDVRRLIRGKYWFTASLIRTQSKF